VFFDLVGGDAWDNPDYEPKDKNDWGRLSNFRRMLLECILIGTTLAVPLALFI
jgi:hypothetical protein